MPGPLTKSVCVLYLTFSRANSMLCLPSAQRPAGTGGRLPTGGGSGASHHARCCREHMLVGPDGLEERGRAGLAHFGERVSAAVSIPWVLASQGSGSAGSRGQGMAAGLGTAGTWPQSPCLCSMSSNASAAACGALCEADPISRSAVGPQGSGTACPCGTQPTGYPALACLGIELSFGC